MFSPIRVCEVELSGPLPAIEGHQTARVLARWYREPLALVDVSLAGRIASPGELAAALWPRVRPLVAQRFAAAGEPELLKRIAAGAVTLEVCPTSNVALGVVATGADVPLTPLLDAGVPVALGADDPLLFGPRLGAQYELARQVHGMNDAELAELARMSVRGSSAPTAIRHRLLTGIDDWLAS